MIMRHTRGAVTWIDLEGPSASELSEVMHEFSIDPRVEEEIASPTPYPLTFSTPEYRYLILHFPATEEREGTKNQEVDFIVGKKFIITARYEVIDSIHALHKVFEAEELIGIGTAPARADQVLERVMSGLYNAIHDEIERAGRSLDAIERAIFSGKERQTVRTISRAGRVLLRFETALARHAEPLDEFLRGLAEPDFYGKPFAARASRIIAAHDHAAALVASYRAIARELRITNDSLLSSSQNEIMKTLTVMAFVAVPLTLVASVFGMNVEAMPIVHERHAFWLILGLMTLVAAAFFSFFKLKRWL
ncbi:MAG TPA: magnesium transporter CorA family protein [Candidatus Paceibacterota bacterium]|nr:magnesium transporter CorA family protein [Candidatus Paceibacterota bacterium]